MFPRIVSRKGEGVMSTAFKAVLVLVAVLTLSVFLTPFVYAVLPVFKFEKIFNRLVMAFAVAGAAWLVRIRKESLKTCGFDFRQPWRQLVAYGFFLGALTVLVVTVIEVIFGPRYVREPIIAADVIQRFVKGMLSGVAVGIVEEFFFRGFVFVQLERILKTWMATLVASAFYSVTHFLDNGQVFIPPNPGIGDAFRLLFGYLEPMTFHTREILPELIGLFLFGVLLNIAFIKARSLFLAIGIHAGAVFAIKWQNAILRKGPDIYHAFFGGTPHYDGVFEWAILVLVGCLIWWFVRRPSSLSS